MEPEVTIVQIQEGSRVFEKDFGVEVKCSTLKNYTYRFHIYRNGVVEEVKEMQPENTCFFMPKAYGDYRIMVEVFEEGKKILFKSSGILDFIEDLIKCNDVRLMRQNNELIVQVDSELELTKEYYAYYLQKDGDVIAKQMYTKENPYHFKVEEPGEYKVKVYMRLIKNSLEKHQVVMESNTIQIK